MRKRAYNNLNSPRFLCEIGYYYRINFEYDKAIKTYQLLCDISKDSMPEDYSYALFKLAILIADALNIVAYVPDKKLPFAESTLIKLPQFSFKLASHYHDKGSLDLACSFFIQATLSDKSLWEDPFCINLALSLIYVKNYAKARALLNSVPNGVNFDSAQNLLRFGHDINCDHIVLFDPNKSLLTELQIIEYKLPFYQQARDAGNEEARVLCGHLEEKYLKLKESEKEPRKNNLSFTENLAREFASSEQHFDASTGNQCN